MARKPLPVPSAQFVRGYLACWDTGINGAVERAIVQRFVETPKNTELGDVLVKATLVNSLYATQVWEIVGMAQHIVALEIDDRLNSLTVDCELVKLIAGYTTSKGNVRTNISFASKYCSFHSPALYPIHDSVARRVLNWYFEHHKFDTFGRGETWDDYTVWERSVRKFCSYFGLDREFSIREVDKFLWMLGKQLGF